jgi:hypothetical protein
MAGGIIPLLLARSIQIRGLEEIQSIPFSLGDFAIDGSAQERLSGFRRISLFGIHSQVRVLVASTRMVEGNPGSAFNIIKIVSFFLFLLQSKEWFKKSSSWVVGSLQYRSDQKTTQGREKLIHLSIWISLCNSRIAWPETIFSHCCR